MTAISVRYDLNEWLYALTRGEERFQLDELPIGTGALLAGLAWFAWRRYREAADAQAAAIVGSVDHRHRVVRDMIASLRPVGLDELGLVAAVEHCLDQWRQRLPDTRISLTVYGVSMTFTTIWALPSIG